MAQLLSNLPIGAKVKFGKHQVGSETPWDIVWLVVAKSHPGYPINSITLLTEQLINQLGYDAKEPNNENDDRKSGGNNRYSLSNIDQWLNSSNMNWYNSTHSADTPPSAEYLNSNHAAHAYDARSGFLYAFTDKERAAILDCTIRVVKSAIDGGGYEDITRKVFLPSHAEIANRGENGVFEGSQWEWFVKNPIYTCTVAPNAYNNSKSELKPYPSTKSWHWLMRTPSGYDNGSDVRFMTQEGSYNTGKAYSSVDGVRPALNLSNTILVSDTIDSDGCYTFVWNTAPLQPTVLTVPDIYGGKSNAISWGSANDPDGDALTYQLECSTNGGDYTQIYSGTATSYTHLVPFGTTSIAYRVKATDPSRESSAYTTSATLTVINNNAPVISGVDYELGVKSSGFSGTYTITDANNNTVTVTEAIDGVQIRSLVATLGDEITYGITDNTWLALPNGSHTFTIRATDGIDTSVRTITFTKLVETLKIQNATPWVASSMPSRIMLVVTRNIPPTATFKVEVCNNGYDTSPTWEDCTDAVKSGLVHVFTNKTKTASNWGVLVRVTVARNGATGACYVSAIGGNFE
jgi:hypothetical protein